MNRLLFEHVFSIPILDGGGPRITMPVHGQLLTRIDQEMYHVKYSNHWNKNLKLRRAFGGHFNHLAFTFNKQFIVCDISRLVFSELYPHQTSSLKSKIFYTY